MRMGMVALGALALALTGCGAAGDVYSLPQAKVKSRLRGMVMPAELGFGPGGSSDATIESSTADLVTWRISSSGQTVGWLEAQLEAVSDSSTRVEVDFRAADDGDGAHANQRKFISSVGRVVLTEAIDAELESRRFSRGRVQAQVALYAMAHRDEMEGWRLDERLSESSSSSYEQSVAAASARHPNLGVAMREAETQRKMEAASRPSLTLPSDDSYRGY